MSEQIDRAKQQSTALRQQLEEITNAKKAASEYAEAAKDEIDTWTERAQKMVGVAFVLYIIATTFVDDSKCADLDAACSGIQEEELASARKQIAELAELDREFPSLQKRLGEETSIRSKALADTEWMRSASVRKADEASTMMEKLETHSNTVLEELATKEERIAELTSKMKEIENKTGEEKHSARMKVIDLEKDVARRDDEIKVKKEDADAVRLKVDNKIKEYDDAMKAIIKQIQRLTGKNLGSDKPEEADISTYNMQSHYMGMASGASSIDIANGPRGIPSGGRPGIFTTVSSYAGGNETHTLQRVSSKSLACLCLAGMSHFPGQSHAGPPPYHPSQPTPILNRAPSSGGSYASSGYSSSGYRQLGEVSITVASVRSA